MAFYTVDYDILTKKFEFYEIEKKISLIHNNMFSDVKIILNWIPQGSIRGHNLFPIYIKGITSLENSYNFTVWLMILLLFVHLMNERMMLNVGKTIVMKIVMLLLTLIVEWWL